MDSSSNNPVDNTNVHLALPESNHDAPPESTPSANAPATISVDTTNFDTSQDGRDTNNDEGNGDSNDKDDDNGGLMALKRNWAKGSHLSYLNSQLPNYIVALNRDKGNLKDVLGDIVNGYFAKFDWRLPVTQEPDPDAPLPDPLEILSATEMTQKREVISRMHGSIKNWMHYRANKVNNNLRHLTSSNRNDPFAILLSKLSGIKTKPSKRLKGWQMYLKEGFDDIRDEFDAAFEASNVPKRQKASKRNEYVAERYSRLEDEVKQAWEARAQQHYEDDALDIETRLAKLETLGPQERQDAINRLGDFFYPIIDGVHQLLKMHVTVLVGGPKPIHGGNINVLSLHAGQNRAPIPRTFGEADETSYKLVCNTFTNFLETCYTQADRREAALPNVSDSVQMQSTFPPPSTQAPSIMPRTAQPPPTDAHPSSRRGRTSRRQETSSSEDSDNGTDSDGTEPETRRQKTSKRQSKSSKAKGKEKLRHHEDEEHSRNKSKARRHVELTDSDDQSNGNSSPPPPLDSVPVGPPRRPKSSASSNKKPRHESSELREPPRRVGTFAYPTEDTPTSPPAIAAPSINPEWPDWFRTQYSKMFYTQSMPTDWGTLLATFVQLEASTNFENPGGPQYAISSEHRPAEVQHWIARAQKPEVEIHQFDEFADEWWTWWRALQPAWRNVADFDNCLQADHRKFDLSISEAPDAWPSLDKPGQNSFLSIIATLRWWGCSLEKTHRRAPPGFWVYERQEGADWLLACIDVIWVMQRITASRLNAGNGAAAGSV
ncbi:hypothetical protein ONZ45_g7536 [Pleurotus djamor]|nr:hypothetical protein ONZ45_g7536 [Pleurotus djamor]